MISAETLQLFKELLDQVSLPASHPEFEEQAARIATARRELTRALESTQDGPATPPAVGP